MGEAGSCGGISLPVEFPSRWGSGLVGLTWAAQTPRGSDLACPGGAFSVPDLCGFGASGETPPARPRPPWQPLVLPAGTVLRADLPPHSRQSASPGQPASRDASPRCPLACGLGSEARAVAWLCSELCPGLYQERGQVLTGHGSGWGGPRAGGRGAVALHSPMSYVPLEAPLPGSAAQRCSQLESGWAAQDIGVQVPGLGVLS